MENWKNWEHKTLIDELTQGMQLAKQLRTLLNSTYSVSQECLLQRILSSFETGLRILNGVGSSDQPGSPAPVGGVLESSNSGDGSPPGERGDQSDVSKKRKTLPTWTDQVKVSSENGLEGPIEDGYNWRKYGQKDILGAKYPRSYYRCSYRSGQNCWATKQVQRSDEDPTVFEIIYKGKHTCKQHKVPSQENQELKPKKHQKHPFHNNFFNFRTNSSWVDTENSAVSRRDTANSVSYDDVAPGFTFPSYATMGYLTEDPQHLEFSALAGYDHTLGSLPPGLVSPAIISPATSETNYFSATTSSSNSPIVDLEFSMDPVELDQNFPFNTPGFFN